MGNKRKSKGRAYLVGELRKHGVSRRLAAKILDLVFHEMSEALKRGEEVEFPFGILSRVRCHLVNEYWVRDRRGYTVVFELNEVGEHLLSPSVLREISLERLRNSINKRYGHVKLPPRPQLRSGPAGHAK